MSADLHITTADGEVEVRGTDSVLRVGLPTLRAGLGLVGPWSARGGRVAALNALDAGFRAGDLRLDVYLSDREIARLGAGARPGPLSARLGFGRIEVRMSSLLRVFAQRMFGR